VNDIWQIIKDKVGTATQKGTQKLARKVLATKVIHSNTLKLGAKAEKLEEVKAILTHNQKSKIIYL
jgi:hypothetical protein